MNKNINAINKKKIYAGIILCIMQDIKDAIIFFVAFRLYMETIFYILKRYMPLFAEALTEVLPSIRLGLVIFSIICIFGMGIESTYINIKKIIKKDKTENCQNE